MKITLPRLQPRNPHAQPARLRQAGAHRKSAGAQRQALQGLLRAELRRLRLQP